MKIYSTCEFCQDRFVSIYRTKKYCNSKECKNKRANISYHKCKKKKDETNNM